MKNTIDKKLVIIALLIIALLCIVNTSAYAAETEKFTLNKETLEVRLNGTGYIGAMGGTGDTTWKSSDETVATVENGNIKGLKIGKTTITATRGTESATCEVNVIYSNLSIYDNSASTASKMNLVLDVHPSETLKVKIEDGKYEEVKDAVVTWKSSDSNIVKVEEKTGKISAVKEGKATITASAAGVTDTIEVTVNPAPVFTDFSKAKFETSFDGYDENLKISGIKPKDSKTYYYYIITAKNEKPELKISKYGSIDYEAMNDKINMLSVNTEENYLYSRKLAKYTELNQELYIWVIQQEELGVHYYDESSNYVVSSTKYVVEGKKIEKAKLPALNLIMQTLSIGSFTYNNNNNQEKDQYTYINFNYPTVTPNRKFTLKIGKVTDKAILSKIQKNDYAGITELLKYAKEHDAVYSKTLTTTSEAYFKSDNSLFDGNKLLQNGAYYYIYVDFDDENGKYYPIEAITLGQAWLSSYDSDWDLWAYTSSDFKWDNLTSTPTESTPKEEPKDEPKPEEDKKDDTQSPNKIPQAGKTTTVFVLIAVMIVISFIARKKMKGTGI